MSWLRDLLSQSQVLLLGWTLVHFLWQGALIAVLLSAVLKGMRRSSAESRYAAACGAMIVLLVCPLVTLATFAPEFVRRVTASGGDAVPASTIGALVQAVGRLLDSPAASQLLKALVGAWGAGVLFLLARLLFGWLRVQQVRRAAVPVDCMPIRGRMSVMALRIGIKKPVRLMESALAQGPAVVGFFRPMILLPTAAITGLWPVQIEAILAHELAHIRRHDYLVNLLQSLVETLLFYHPAVWWVSARIREERENCCDDLAVKACGDRTFYAGCLADLDDLRPSPMELAMGAAGGSLLWRIRRILLLPDRETRTAVPTVAALAMLMTSGLLVAGIARTQANVPQGNVTADRSLHVLASEAQAPVDVVIQGAEYQAFRPIPVAEAIITFAPRVPFPQLSASSVWSAGGWLEHHWPSVPAEMQPEGMHQAGEEIQVPSRRDLGESDFPKVSPMSRAVRSDDGIAHPDILPTPVDASVPTPDFAGDTTARWPLTTIVGGQSMTVTGGPLNTVSGGPINTVTGGPINTANGLLTTVTGGPLMTVTGGPLMTVRGGPIMATTGNPMVNRGPNYPRLTPSIPPTTNQGRRSR
jgi:beta-lactamase regulating signal transducer with metallopeptidase domain